MPDKAYWLGEYYNNYANQVKNAGGTPLSREQWENHINSDRLDQTANSFLTSELDKLETDTSVKNLQNEYQGQLDTLVGDLTKSGNERLANVKTERSQRLKDLASLLGKQADEQFSLDSPEILEQLNSRGLLKSSATGEAMAREKANLQKQVDNSLQQQGLADLDYEQQMANDIFKSTMGLKEKGMDYIAGLSGSGLQRKFQLGDLANQTKQAWDMNYANEKAAKEASDKALLGDLIQTGAGIALAPFTGGTSLLMSANGVANGVKSAYNPSSKLNAQGYSPSRLNFASTN